MVIQLIWQCVQTLQVALALVYNTPQNMSYRFVGKMNEISMFFFSRNLIFAGDCFRAFILNEKVLFVGYKKQKQTNKNLPCKNGIIL